MNCLRYPNPEPTRPGFLLFPVPVESGLPTWARVAMWRGPVADWGSSQRAGPRHRLEEDDAMTRRVFRYAGRDWPDPRTTRAWRRLRDQVVDEEPTCQLRIVGVCTTVSTTADHIVPVPVRPDLALARTNLRGACGPCNEARRQLPDAALVTDRDRRPPALDLFG